MVDSERARVIEESEDKLSQVTWRFWHYEGRNALVLDSYIVSKRETKRHAYKLAQGYFRQRPDRFVRYEPIAESAVPWTTEIRARALEEFMKKLRVVLWSEVSEARSLTAGDSVDDGGQLLDLGLGELPCTLNDPREGTIQT